jgi:hypothetical protein
MIGTRDGQTEQMGSGRRCRALALAALPLVALVACHSDTEPRVKPGTGYSAVVAWAVAKQFPDASANSEKPLVFITTSDGSAISATTQAKVIRDAGDAIKINFVDRREDAIDAQDPVEAVKDDGLLVTVGPIASDARSSVEVPVQLYTNYVENSTWKLLLVADGDTVSVTQAEEQTPAPT